jgi:hypothetical protein
MRGRMTEAVHRLRTADRLPRSARRGMYYLPLQADAQLKGQRCNQKTAGGPATHHLEATLLIKTREGTESLRPQAY